MSSYKEPTKQELHIAQQYVERMYDLGCQFYGGSDSFLPEVASDIRKLHDVKQLGLKVIDILESATELEPLSLEERDSVDKLRILLDELRVPGEE